jgi:hypothetical protein
MGNSIERNPNVLRRILLVFSVAALMAMMLVASAMPAFAVARERANCVGLNASGGNQLGKEFGISGLGGRSVAGTAQIVGGWGEAASNNCADVAD